jgi:hypothetical protein
MLIMQPVSDKSLPLATGMRGTYVISEVLEVKLGQLSQVPTHPPQRVTSTHVLQDKRLVAIVLSKHCACSKQFYLRRTNKRTHKTRAMTSGAHLSTNTAKSIHEGTWPAPKPAFTVPGIKTKSKIKVKLSLCFF